MDNDLDFGFEPIDELEGYETDDDGTLKGLPAELFMVGPLDDGSVWLGVQVRSPGSEALTPIQVRLAPQHAVMMGEMLQNAGKLQLANGPKN